MTSSSVILSNILTTDKCELGETINKYLETKLKEFQEIMKSKVDSIIADKIDKFYSKPFEDHETVLFDKNGEDLINKHNQHIESIFIKGTRSYTHFEIQNFKKLNFLSKENTKCFTIAFVNSHNGGANRIRELSFFKTFLIERSSYPPSQDCFRVWNSLSFKHNLSTDCLFAIKYFQVANEPVKESGSNTPSLNTSIKLLEQHPEYFKKNCSEFEEICRKEYAEIEKTKSQLRVLMDEQISKKDYYDNLEKKIKELELEKKQLEKDKMKVKEEKRKWYLLRKNLCR